MRTSPLEIFPLFRNSEMVNAVYHLYLSEQEISLTDLAAQLGCSKATLSAQLGVATRAGIISVRKIGRTSMLSANKDSVFYKALLELIELTHGPAAVLGQELSGIDGIDEAKIYGSWAARMHGEPGHAPRDIDVLIIGDADNLEVIKACMQASERLHREVNPKMVTRHDWDNKSSALLAAISERPLWPIEMSEKTERETETDTSFDHLTY